MTRVCVVGSVNMDISFDVDTLPRPGETALAASVRSTPGGKGANQAVAAARAGAHVQFVGAVGDDPAAAQLREHLNANGVGTDGLITVPGRSGTAAIIVDSAGENIIVVAPGANGRLTLDSAASRAARRRLRCVVAAVGDSGRHGDGGCPRGPFGRRDRHPQRLAVGRRRGRAGRAGRGDGRLGGQRNRSRALGLAGPASSDHPRRPRRPLHRRRCGVHRGRAGRARRSTRPAPATCSPACWLPGWAVGRDHALRRACAAGALATLVPGAGDCAPYAEAIDEATLPQ